MLGLLGSVDITITEIIKYYIKENYETVILMFFVFVVGFSIGGAISALIYGWGENKPRKSRKEGKHGKTNENN